MTKNQINILIADDHQIVIEGLKSLLIDQPSVKVIAEASNGLEVLNILKEKTIDIVVLDIEMPKLDGIDTLKIIKKDYTEVKVLMFSSYGTEVFVKNVIHLGVDGYVLKSNGKEDFLKALNSLAIDEPYLGKGVVKTLMNYMKNLQIKPVELTKRERQVLELIANGYSTPQISERLNIAHSTVETYRRNLIDKLNVKNSQGLVRYAIENKIT